jgi:hypothetical protein
LEQARRGAGHTFATYEWKSAWWRWFGAGRELYSFRCSDERGRVGAILPRYVAAARPMRIARFLGYGGMQSPVCGRVREPACPPGPAPREGAGRRRAAQAPRLGASAAIRRRNGRLRASPDLADTFEPRDHGSTFAGGPLAATAVRDPKLLRRVRLLACRLGD